MKPEEVPVDVPQDNDLEIILQKPPGEAEKTIFKYSPEQLKKYSIEGWACLFGGVSLHLVLGTFYLWGGISPYVASHLKEYDSSVTMTTMSLVFPILGLAMFSMLSFGVKLAQRIGFKTTIFFGGFFISLAFLICAFIKSFVGFIVIYCIFVGISSGLVYMLPILCGWKYFPNNRGRVSGIIIAGYGFGSFIFNFICQAFVNPHNKKPSIPYTENGKVVKYFESSISEKVPGMFLMMAGSYAGLSIISLFLIRYNETINLEKHYESIKIQKQETSSPQKSEKTNSPNQQPSESPAPVACCESFLEALLSRPFFFLMPMIMCSTFFGLLMANCYKIYGLQVGLEDQMLTIVGSIASVSNGLSRGVFAALVDRFGFKIVYCGIQLSNLAVTAAIGYIGSNQIAYLFLLAILMGCYGAMLSIFPTVSSKLFGTKVGPIIYGLLFFGIGVSNMIAYLFYKYVTPSIELGGLFWVCFGIKCIALILGIFFKETHDWSKK